MCRRAKYAGPGRDEETQGRALGRPPKGKIGDSEVPTRITRGKHQGHALGRFRPSHLQENSVCGHLTPAACPLRPPTSTRQSGGVTPRVKTPAPKNIRRVVLINTGLGTTEVRVEKMFTVFTVSVLPSRFPHAARRDGTTKPTPERMGTRLSHFRPSHRQGTGV